MDVPWTGGIAGTPQTHSQSLLSPPLGLAFLPAARGKGLYARHRCKEPVRRGGGKGGLRKKRQSCRAKSNGGKVASVLCECNLVSVCISQ